MHVTIVFVFKLFSLSDKISRWVKDVAQHDTNEINLEERLLPTKCDKMTHMCGLQYNARHPLSKIILV